MACAKSARHRLLEESKDVLSIEPYSPTTTRH